ncbi:MAG: OsmC family protein [Acidimicrobiales bacterium]
MTDLIASRLASLAEFYVREPDRAVAEDSPATATLGSDLVCEVRGPDGWMVKTAMMAGVGGDASAPTPGWIMRSAIASCTATTVAMRAAQAGIPVQTVEVVAESESDGRGLLGIDGHHPEPSEMLLTVKVSAPGVAPERVEQLVKEADLSSPIGESLRKPLAVITRVVHVDAD